MPTRSPLLPIAAFVILLISSLAHAQDVLTAGRRVEFSLTPGESRTYRLAMKQGDFAEIAWNAGEGVYLGYSVTDPAGNELASGSSDRNDSTAFIAPRDGEYTFSLRFDNNSEAKGTQKISLNYGDKFRLPAGSKQDAARKINGYDVRIISTPVPKDSTGYSLVLVEKGKKLRNILKAEGEGEVMKFTFADAPASYDEAAEKRSKALIKSSSDITGDGVPDVMINYYSGGAHCCFESYFINLGDTPELVDHIDAANSGLAALRKNPKGGLLFETADNAWAYWRASFAESPLPRLVMEFKNNKLRPNFDLMKKPAPSAASLRAKARTERAKVSTEPYAGEDGAMEYPFWGEMLDLIYTGNEQAAWQYFEMVWPPKREGKELFLKDFKAQLAESFYGKRER
jgi:hypothetical protein